MSVRRRRAHRSFSCPFLCLLVKLSLWPRLASPPRSSLRLLPPSNSLFPALPPASPGSPSFTEKANDEPCLSRLVLDHFTASIPRHHFSIFQYSDEGFARQELFTSSRIDLELLDLVHLAALVHEGSHLSHRGFHFRSSRFHCSVDPSSLFLRAAASAYEEPELNSCSRKDRIFSSTTSTFLLRPPVLPSPPSNLFSPPTQLTTTPSRSRVCSPKHAFFIFRLAPRRHLRSSRLAISRSVRNQQHFQRLHHRYWRFPRLQDRQSEREHDLHSLQRCRSPGSTKFTHIRSGFGASNVTSRIVSSTYAVVTIVSTQIGGTVTHYHVAKSGTPTIYIATHVTEEPGNGELRFIARLKKSVVPNGNVAADVSNGCSAIEAGDVNLCADGLPHSKFYSSIHHIDDQVHGVTGTNIGVWIVIPGTAYERGSGGPFFRDINNQGGSIQELYYYMNSGHMQTEAYRFGLSGPYAMVFNTGATPSSDLDVSFFEKLSITGYTAASARGTVQGTASGIASAFFSKIVVGWSNTQAQYWTRASTSGAFISPLMIPGTYNQTLYKSELVVGTSSVVVTAGKITTGSNIASTEVLPSTIWTIGDADGTPSGFLNADKIETMHPSDVRMGSWGAVNFTVGASLLSSFPMAQFMAVNNPITVYFNLTAAQAAVSRVFEIGTTSSFGGGRPMIAVNGIYTPKRLTAAPKKIDSRGVTRGTWRGNNVVYQTTIPVGKLFAGSNSVVISVISGSSGDGFLSSNIVYDFVRLY